MANSFPIEEDASIRIGREIMSFINRRGLPFKADQPTTADGDCFVSAVIQQLQRPSIAADFGQLLQSVDLQNFKLLVRQFIFNSSHPRVLAMKETFKTLEGLPSESDFRTVDIGMSWENYWENIVKPKVWASETFIQSVAWFLKRDIMIITINTDDHIRYINTIINSTVLNIPYFKNTLI